MIYPNPQTPGTEQQMVFVTDEEKDLCHTVGVNKQQQRCPNEDSLGREPRRKYA
jgi:hypothetical protein